MECKIVLQHDDSLIETASQTAGPYVHIGCLPTFAGVDGIYSEDLGKSPIAPGARGEQIVITGTIYDGAGAPVCDALFESWQADAGGLYAGQTDADPHVSGFCRFAADKDSGVFALTTIKPGQTCTRDGLVFAPHIALWIVARGVNIGLATRIYFEDEDNSADPLLERVEPVERVQTLIARKTGAGAYAFDIHLQGAHETVFLDM